MITIYEFLNIKLLSNTFWNKKKPEEFFFTAYKIII